MEDTYLKVGIVVVAVAVMALLIAFAFRALTSQAEIPEDIQSFSGTARQLEYKIASLCTSCMSEQDRECFLINAEITEGNISAPGKFIFANFNMLLPGKHSLRIESNSSKCVIQKME